MESNLSLFLILSFQFTTALSEVFERNGVANRMFLRPKLLTNKMEKGDDLENHLLEFDKFFYVAIWQRTGSADVRTLHI